jgi:hypothetical protein
MATIPFERLLLVRAAFWAMTSDGRIIHYEKHIAWRETFSVCILRLLAHDMPSYASGPSYEIYWMPALVSDSDSDSDSDTVSSLGLE